MTALKEPARSELQLETGLEDLSGFQITSTAFRLPHTSDHPQSRVERFLMALRAAYGDAELPSSGNYRLPRKPVADPHGLRRRRDAALRLPPLETGVRDPWSGV